MTVRRTARFVRCAHSYLDMSHYCVSIVTTSGCLEVFPSKNYELIEEKSHLIGILKQHSETAVPPPVSMDIAYGGRTVEMTFHVEEVRVPPSPFTFIVDFV